MDDRLIKIWYTICKRARGSGDQRFSDFCRSIEDKRS